ncbi:MAG: GNAT family N-acetyltransferase [Deltaproteobacteria bacterium]|nr:GNAT family N-acetyltransferase [Deltaproteobacteria bacterium]
MCQWIKDQHIRYQYDGYGYHAVISETDFQIIGQAGLAESAIGFAPITELGYIFDTEILENGLISEAPSAMIALAFETYALDSIYCTISPHNTSSLGLAQRLGFNRTVHNSSKSFWAKRCSTKYLEKPMPT